MTARPQRRKNGSRPSEVPQRGETDLLLDALFSAATNFVGIFDVIRTPDGEIDDYRYVRVSDNCYEYTHQTAEQLVGSTLGTIWPTFKLTAGRYGLKSVLDKVVKTHEPVRRARYYHSSGDNPGWAFLDSHVLGKDRVFLSTHMAERQPHGDTIAEIKAFAQAVFLATDSFIVVLSPRGQIINANHSFYALARTGPTGTIGKYISDVVRWDVSVEEIYSCIDQACDAIIRKEWGITLETGEKRVIEFSIKPILRPSNEIDYLILEGRDCTEKSITSEAIKSSESKFRNLVEGSLQGIFVHKDRVPLFANATMAEMLGFAAPVEIFELPDISEFMSSDYMSYVDELRRDAVKGRPRAPSIQRFRMMRQDGTDLYVAVTARVVTWGGETAIQSSFIDISREVSAISQLSQANNFLDQAKKIALMGLFEWHESWGDMVIWTDEAYDLHGIPRAKMIDHAYMEEIMGPDQYARWRQVLTETDGNFDLDYSTRRADDGRIIWLNLNGKVLKDPTGKPTQFYGILRDVTEKTEEARKLAESEERFRLLGENTKDIIALHDQLGRILYISPSIKNLGGSPEEFIGKRGWDLVPVKESNILESWVRDDLPRGISLDNLITEVDLPPRGQVFLEVNAQPVWDRKAGAFTKYVSSSRDVTDRILTQKKLGEAEFSKTEAQRLGRMGNWSYSSAVNEYEISEPMRWILRLPPDRRVTAHDFWSAVHPDDLDMVRQLVARSLNCTTNEEHTGDWRLRLEDGTVIHTFNKWVYEPRDDGYISMSGVTQDITERVKSARRDFMLREGIQRSPVPIVVGELVQGELLISLVNDSWRTLTGYSTDEAKGRQVFFTLNPASSRTIRTRVNKSMNTQTSITFETALITKTGEEIPVETTLSPIIIDNEITAAIIIQRDMRVERERELREKRAVKIDSLGMIASTVAHEINNLLQPIASSASVLSRNLANMEEKRLFEEAEKIKMATRQASSVVRGILSFARSEVQSESEKVKPVPFIKEVKSALQFASTTVPSRVALHLNFPENDDGLAAITMTHMRVIVMNLLKNSLYAMADSGDIYVRSYRETLSMPDLEEREYHVLEFRDTGPGFPAEALEKAFDPFFTTKPDGAGTGIGLSTVYNTVEVWGGRMTVGNHPDGGALVSIFIPVVRADQIASPDAKVLEATSSPA